MEDSSLGSEPAQSGCSPICVLDEGVKGVFTRKDEKDENQVSIPDETGKLIPHTPKHESCVHDMSTICPRYVHDMSMYACGYHVLFRHFLYEQEAHTHVERKMPTGYTRQDS